MKLFNLIKNPPAFIAIPLCMLGGALYIGALIALKTLLN
tara:strand:- start:430 stop:546 length:117 start_codon:yes stop_codon:yes gene_type:complete